MSADPLLMGQRSESQRAARREVIRLLRKLSVYGASVDEFVSLREDRDTVQAIGAMWDAMRDLRKAAKELEALAVEPEPTKDKVPDIDPPDPQKGGAAHK